MYPTKPYFLEQMIHLPGKIFRLEIENHSEKWIWVNSKYFSAGKFILQLILYIAINLIPLLRERIFQRYNTNGYYFWMFIECQSHSQT